MIKKKEERITRLIEMLITSRRVTIKTASSALKISESTTRRLFSNLETQGKLIRVHGGVQLIPELSYDYSYRLSSQNRIHQKTTIGNYAADLIHDNESIFFDSGTTVMKLAEALSLRLQMEKVKNLVVLTNSINLIDHLAHWCKVLFIGGEVRMERRDVCGTISERILSLFNFDKAFLGADGIDLRNGLMTIDERTAKMNEIVLERSENSYVLADSSKFNKQSLVTYANLKQITAIITDNKLDEELKSKFLLAGVAVHSAPN